MTCNRKSSALYGAGNSNDETIGYNRCIANRTGSALYGAESSNIDKQRFNVRALTEGQGRIRRSIIEAQPYMCMVLKAQMNDVQ